MAIAIAMDQLTPADDKAVAVYWANRHSADRLRKSLRLAALATLIVPAMSAAGFGGLHFGHPITALSGFLFLGVTIVHSIWLARIDAALTLDRYKADIDRLTSGERDQLLAEVDAALPPGSALRAALLELDARHGGISERQRDIAQGALRVSEEIRRVSALTAPAVAPDSP